MASFCFILRAQRLLPGGVRRMCLAGGVENPPLVNRRESELTCPLVELSALRRADRSKRIVLQPGPSFEPRTGQIRRRVAEKEIAGSGSSGLGRRAGRKWGRTQPG